MPDITSKPYLCPSPVAVGSQLCLVWLEQLALQLFSPPSRPQTMAVELTPGLAAIAWFDRVASSSNPVVGLSRGDTSGPCTLQPLSLPQALLHKLRGVLPEPQPHSLSALPARQPRRGQQ